VWSRARGTETLSTRRTPSLGRDGVPRRAGALGASGSRRRDIVVDGPQDAAGESGPASRGLARARGADRGDGAPAPTTQREGVADRPERELLGDAADRRGARRARA